MALESGNKNSIRSVDFKNFSYPLFPEAKKVAQRMKSPVQVKNGCFEIKWKDPMFYGQEIFCAELIIFGDITGDEIEDAIVNSSFSFGSHRQEYLYIYTIADGKLALLHVPDIGEQIERDYSKYNTSKDTCDDGVWAYSAKAIRKGLLELELTIGNQHHCFDEKKGYNMATMKYRLDNNRWVLAEPPRRWRAKR